MIGRKKERKELIDLYDSNRAELVAIYGRRRVGKTYLIDETFENRFTFRHAGISPAEHEKKGLMKKQLDGFYLSLLKQGMTPRKKPKTWMEAFFQLEEYLEQLDKGERQLVFMDELPWMDTPRSGFLTAFEWFWNNWGCHRKNLMVVVCGSANSWILDNLINNHGGLYNRVTYEIQLSPFSLRECEDFLSEREVALSRYDIVQSYMITGGIPYYLGYYKKELSLAQNVDNLFFSKNAKLRNEFDRLFESVFERPETMKAIVRKLATKGVGFSRSELLQALEMKDGEIFTKCINALITSEFVEKYVPFNCSRKECYYRLVDFFSLFWLHFIEGNQELDENFWLQNLDSQVVVVWRGLTFERICRQHIPQIKKALGVSGVSTKQSAWFENNGDEPGLQIDLLIERKDNIVNMCEIKYLNREFSVDSDYYKTILARSGRLSEIIAPNTAVHSTLITTFGLKKNKYSGAFTNVITMGDLFTDE